MHTKWVEKANEKWKRDERAGFDTLREFIADRARALRSSHGKHYIEILNANSKQSVSSKMTQQTKKQGTQGKQIAMTTTLTTQSASTQPTSKPAASASNLTSDNKRNYVLQQVRPARKRMLRIHKGKSLLPHKLCKRKTFMLQLLAYWTRDL